MYASWYIFTSHKTPELFQWFFIIVGLVAASCFDIPYFIVLYKRFKGSILPFPRLFVCLILVVCFCLPGFDNFYWTEAAISCGVSVALYCILFLLPDNKKMQ